MTTQGMKEEQMKIIAQLITDVLVEVKPYQLPEGNKGQYIADFKKKIASNEVIKGVRKQVKELMRGFETY